MYEAELVSKSEVESTVSTLGERFVAAVSDLFHGDFAKIGELAGTILLPSSLVLLSIVVSYFVAKFVARVASAPVCRRVDETLGRFIGKLIFNSIIVAAFLIALSKFGVNVTSFAAVLGAAGFAVGLAFQGTLSNFASGILLLVFRPFKVGDMVVCAGVTGKVNEIDLFTTTLDTPDNRRIIVPNSSISGNTIENVTHHPHRRVEITVGVAYECSIESTRTALIAAAESLRPLLIDQPDRGYQVILSSLAPSSVDWMVRFWGQTKDFAIIRESLTIAIKQQMDTNGLRIPYPQMDVHFDARSMAALPLPSTSEPKAEPTEVRSRQLPRPRRDQAA